MTVNTASPSVRHLRGTLGKRDYAPTATCW